MTIARPGSERPLSMKLRWRWVVPARTASSSWLSRRRLRQRRSAPGNPLDSMTVTMPFVAKPQPPSDSLQGIAPCPNVGNDRRPMSTAPRRSHVNEATEIADRYVAIWNEPHPETRGRMVAEIWSSDGVHVLQPTQEAREAAAALAMGARFESRGHAELEARVANAHARFIAPGEYAFQGRGDAVRLGDMVKFGWEMVPAAGGEPAGSGLEILILDAEGRARLDYQFIDG